MAKAEGENNYPHYTFIEHPNSYESFYEIKKGERLDVAITTRPDDFFLEWPTRLTRNQFFLRSSQLIDNMSDFPLPSRRYDGEAPYVEVTLDEDNTSKEFTIAPSYTGYGFDNLHINGSLIDFTETKWPLNIDGINRTIQAKNNPDSSSITDSSTDFFARINAPHCSLLLYNDLFKEWDTKSYILSFWSDRYPRQELSDLYQDTATNPIPVDLFQSKLDTLVGERIIKKSE